MYDLHSKEDKKSTPKRSDTTTTVVQGLRRFRRCIRSETGPNRYFLKLFLVIAYDELSPKLKKNSLFKLQRKKVSITIETKEKMTVKVKRQKKKNVCSNIVRSKLLCIN